jgi:GNAT superfamily N-acetyltransferase
MVRIAESDSDILKCRTVLCELRPHLKEEFYPDAVHQTLADNRMLIFVEENDVAVSAAVFEWGYNLYRGKYIYIDDLTTLPQSRGKGYASQLLDWIMEYAKEKEFDQVHLDSGVNAGRFDAHRLYLNKGFNVTSLHFAMKVKG